MQSGFIPSTGWLAQKMHAPQTINSTPKWPKKLVLSGFNLFFR
jgi:hypothetical protein